MAKHGYVERVGNAYRVADKVNIHDLQKKLQPRSAEETAAAHRPRDRDCPEPICRRNCSPDLQKKLQRRIDLVTETAQRLSELRGSNALGP